MSPIAESPAQTSANQPSFASEVFHKLSQPLTALQCWLELSLVRDETPEEFRNSVQAALQNAERLRHSLLLLRELSDADDPGDVSAPVHLRELLLELRDDFLPVCESAGGSFRVSCPALQVRGSQAKLRQAFFRLLEHVLQSSEGRNLCIDVRTTNGGQAEIRLKFHNQSLSGSSAQPSQFNPTGELDIARRALRAAGGDLSSPASTGRQGVLIAKLCLAASFAKLP